MVEYRSNRGELMKVTAICKRKSPIKTPNRFRLDVKLKKVDSYVAKCNQRIEA